MSLVHRRLVALGVLGALVGIALAAPAAGAASTPIRNPGVVIINLQLGYEGARAAGTGMVLTSTGEVLTNNHVIAQATAITVKVPSTHRTYTATVLGYDVTHDTALLQISGATGLKTVSTGASAKVKPGDAVHAVGNAGGTGHLTTSHGKVLRLSRTIVAGDELGSERLRGLIESDARIRAGDSGGPLFDHAGKVIGMNTAGSVSGLVPATADPSTSDGFAIPIGRALSIVHKIVAGRASKTIHVGESPFLGIQVASSARRGVVIVGVVRGSAADGAGIDPGDALVSIAGRKIHTPDGVSATLWPHHPGDQVGVRWSDPSGQQHTATVTLGPGPPQ